MAGWPVSAAAPQNSASCWTCRSPHHRLPPSRRDAGLYRGSPDLFQQYRPRRSPSTSARPGHFGLNSSVHPTFPDALHPPSASSAYTARFTTPLTINDILSPGRRSGLQSRSSRPVAGCGCRRMRQDSISPTLAPLHITVTKPAALLLRSSILANRCSLGSGMPGHFGIRITQADKGGAWESHAKKLLDVSWDT
jgi:hypothetical protein